MPQGTVLGPLLCMIIISDINKDISSSKIISFADDTRVYTNITQIEDSDSLQTEIKYIYLWDICHNNMLFNTNKSNNSNYSNNKRNNYSNKSIIIVIIVIIIII